MRGSLSLSGPTWERLRDYAKASGKPITQALVEIMEPVLSGPPLQAPPPMTEADAIENIRRKLADIQGKTCALCTGSLDLRSTLQPLGKDGAPVPVCHACNANHPRTGRYAFSGGRTIDGPRQVLIGANADGRVRVIKAQAE